MRRIKKKTIDDANKMTSNEMLKIIEENYMIAKSMRNELEKLNSASTEIKELKGTKKIA